MITYIVLLRGINVGGHKKVPMAELRKLLGKVGFSDVKTYIQSGNVVLKSDKNKNEVENLITKTIVDGFGFEVSVLVKTVAEIQSIFNTCPFEQSKKENSYFTILHSVPDIKLVKAAEQFEYPNEEFVITDVCVYLYSSVGYGRAKCNNNFFENKLKISTTSRNYRTMRKLLEMSA